MSESTALVSQNDEDMSIGFLGTDNPFMHYAESEGVSDASFMRCNGNNGRFIIGEEEIDGGVYAFDMYNSKIGYIGFDEDNKPHHGPEVTFLSRQPLAKPDPIPGVRWNKQIRVVCVDPDTGREVLLSCKAAETGQRPRPMQLLVKEYGQKMPLQKDEHGYKVPLVEFSSRSFQVTIEEPQADGTKRKIKATKYAPTYKIVDWVSKLDVAAYKAGATSADEAEAQTADPKEIVIEHVPETQKKAMPATNTTAPAGGMQRARFGQRG